MVMSNKCPGSAFCCNYGACVSKNSKCNGKYDCVDGSDEKLPECKKLDLSISSSPTRPQQEPVRLNAYDFEDAKRKLKKSEVNADLNTDVEKEKKSRKKWKKKKTFVSSSDNPEP
ncbi:complement factor I-like [Metopolophium dirhodum]|uniref:complement factor I-like n=1 Tax=Metopolophium dirhodum TaxID=44670 RepID=UPI00298F3FBA|nr:complement factor I-like [Metopolophium dirhodum]